MKERKNYSFSCSYEFLQDMMNGGRNSYTDKLLDGSSIMLNFDGKHSILNVRIEAACDGVDIISAWSNNTPDEPSGKDSCLKYWRG